MPDERRFQELTADPQPWWGLGEVVRLSVPMVLNTVSYTIMQFVDGWMVSRVSKEALSAQFIGGISAFVPVCFFIGLLGCVNTFASQNLGAGRRERSALYGWQGLWLAWSAAGGLTFLILLAPYLLGLFGHEAEVTRLETQYFRILIGGGLFTLSARALGAFFVGVHRPGITLVAGVAANVVNLIGNYVLIYGKFGFPALGLAGAGIGTVMGSAVESAILMTVFVGGAVAREFDVRGQWRIRWAAMVDLLRIGSPAGAMFLGDVLMWAIFMGRVIGGFGTADLAAAAILNRYWHLCFMPVLGISMAVTAIVGRFCGAGQPRLAWRRAHAGLLLVEAYMVTCGVVIWVAREPLVGIFNEAANPLVQSIAARAMIFILLCQAFDALSVVFIGALRGAGDTLWPGAVQLVLAWGLGLGGSAAVARVWPEWGSFGSWAAVMVYIMLLGSVMWGRFLGGRWQRIKVVAPSAAPAMEESVVLPPV